MILPQAAPGWWSKAARGSAAVTVLLAIALAPSAYTQSDPGWNDVDLAQYRQHLDHLDGVISDCQAQRNLKRPVPSSDNVCDPNRVGANDRVTGAVAGDSQPREVRYDWLRSVLARAGARTSPPQAETLKLVPGAKTVPPPTVDNQLAEARARIRSDEEQAGAPVQPNPGYASERQALAGILSQRAYKGVNEVSPREKFIEWFYAQLNKFLASLVRFGMRSRWIVWTLRGLLLLGIGVGLIWAFMRIDRSGQIKLVPDDMGPASGAPSAREWQLWLKDAQAMAAKAEWRDAIHLLYWAAISRLESRRTWPADRARTPREYLGLMPGSDPRAQTLIALTRNFERTWYGGREAGSGEFQSAMEQASSLGVKPE
jgi:uncharacterized protein DUF4129